MLTNVSELDNDFGFLGINLSKNREEESKYIAERKMKSEIEFRLNKIGSLQKQDIHKQHFISNLRKRKAKKKRDDHSGVLENNFSHLTFFKLNKGVMMVLTEKKHLLEEEMNTEIERSNRLLHEKLKNYTLRSLPHTKKRQITNDNQFSPQKSKKKENKIKANQTLPVLKRNFDSESTKLIKSSEKQAMTLFIGSSKIDGFDMKIKIAISDGIYYLIAQNEEAKVVLEMPEEEYWSFHYKEFEENPCNIFKYLKFGNGEIKFKVTNVSERSISGSKGLYL